MAATIFYIKVQISFVVLFMNLWINVECGGYLCPSLCSCLGSMVDCSNRGLETIPSDIPTWVEILDLSSNSIEEAEVVKFQGLLNLTELNLNNNEIKALDPQLFPEIPNVKTLKLAYNELEDIPTFPTNYNLTQLALSHNKIRSIEATLLRPVFKLRQLDLSFNRISILQNGSFPFLPNLHHLYLNSNRINRLVMGCFGTLPNLEWLKLGKNQIADLPKEIFKKLAQLKHLDLNKNKLRAIVGLTFNGSENLATLILKRNNITQLADGCFWGLKKIQSLELDNNSLTQVKKAGLYGLESLKSMSLSRNQIKDIETGSWDFCPHLTTLDLTENKLERVDSDTFSNLRALDGLWLNNNHISYIGIGAFNDLFSLKTLEMNNNEISGTIEDMHAPFEGLASLTRLSLESNQIRTITKKAFQGLEMLRQLDLVHNQISTIQKNAFQDLKELKTLFINTSALLCDCELSWFPEWLEQTGFLSSVWAKCSHPEELRSISVVEVSQFKCDKFPKPVIMTAPVSQIALKGSNISLHCVAWSSSNSSMKIDWLKDKIAVNHAKINTTSTRIDEGVRIESVLVINHSQDQHAGDYQCVAENDVGPIYSAKAKISVHVFPMFTKKPEDVTVKSGAKIQLECAAVGEPAPEISWQKDGGDDFPAARERRMHIQQDNDIYFISSVKIEDMGVYSCMASNAAGTVVTNATLTVLEIPKFAKPMLDKDVKQGSTAVLECMAQGSPKPRLEWQKNDEPLEFSLTERHFFTKNDQHLLIMEVRREDSGKYTCIMTNTLGSDRASMELNVVSPTGGSKAVGIFSDNYTTTGIIIIAVVCCVVGTSLIWVVIIYQTRRKNEEYSSTPTEETTIPEVAYNSVDQNVCTRTIYTAQGAYSKVYVNNGPYSSIQKQNGGVNVHMNGGFNITHNPMGNEDWAEVVIGGVGEYEQNSREPLVTSSNNSSCHGNTSHIERCRSSISVNSSNSSSSSCSSLSSTRGQQRRSPGGVCSTVVLSTFHPYPLGSPPTTPPPTTPAAATSSYHITNSSVPNTTTVDLHPHLATPCRPTMLQEGSPSSPTSTFVHNPAMCSQPDLSPQQNIPHTADDDPRISAPPSPDGAPHVVASQTQTLLSDDESSLEHPSLLSSNHPPASSSVNHPASSVNHPSSSVNNPSSSVNHPQETLQSSSLSIHSQPCSEDEPLLSQTHTIPSELKQTPRIPLSCPELKPSPLEKQSLLTKQASCSSSSCPSTSSSIDDSLDTNHNKHREPGLNEEQCDDVIPQIVNSNNNTPTLTTPTSLPPSHIALPLADNVVISSDLNSQTDDSTAESLLPPRSSESVTDFNPPVVDTMNGNTVSCSTSSISSSDSGQLYDSVTPPGGRPTLVYDSVTPDSRANLVYSNNNTVTV